MADMKKSIKEATDLELDMIIRRLRREREAQSLIGDLRYRSTPADEHPYMDNHVSTEAVIDTLYHYGIKGMRWGVRRSKSQIAKDTKNVKSKRAEASKNRRTLSDKDIEKRIQRLQNEKKLKDLTEADVAPGKAMAKRIISTSGEKVAKAMVTGAALYAVKAAMSKQFDLKEAAKYVAPKPKK